MSMKIGFVLDDRLDKPDGVQQYVKLVAHWMKSQGHEVHYLVGDSPKATERNVHNLGRTVGVKFNKNRMAIPLPASRKKIKALLDHEKFDVLHVQMPYSPLLAGRVVSAAGPHTAVIGTFHILPHGFLSSAGTRLLGKVLSRNKRRFDLFFSVSEAARTFSRTHFGIYSIVMPNVVDIAKYQIGTPIKKYADKRNIVFLGRLVERKGAQHLLEAVKQLVASTDKDMAASIRVIICGDGPLRSELKAAAKSVGTEVVFTGFLKEEDKADYLASAEIAVYPATGGESFGIVLIEAMAARAGVVLAGNNPGYASVLSTIPEVLFDPHDAVAAGTLLRRILSDDRLAISLHERQQELVRTFAITKVGPEIEACYRQALAKQHHKRDT